MPPGASRSCRATSRRSRASRPTAGWSCRIGAHSHGQGLETTLSQVAHSILGVPHDRIRLVHGDTAETPYSTGTWGSRCMIMAGGAVAAACDELAARVQKIGAGLLQAKPEEVRLEDGEVVGPSGRIAVADVARTWYRRPQDLPPDVDPGGLEVTAGYKAKRDTGTFSYAAHAAVVAVDTETGELEILDYVVVEDGGTLVNPMIVDGQICGGAAQGIGTALYEEMRFDAQAQPLASTLSDYLLPGPTEVPDIRIVHMETPSPYTRFGQKGIGEGGAIAPPAAITNAVNDALAGLGVELLVSPITPRRIVEAISRAEVRRQAKARRMKPVAFDYARPATVARGAADAGRQCRRQGAGRRPDAGADAQPAARAAGAAGRHHAHPRAGGRQRGRATAVTIGATVTHAAIEDGRVPDPDRRLPRARRPRHRLSRGAHARHHRRQPGPCRPGGRLARPASPRSAPRWWSRVPAAAAACRSPGSCAAPWRRSWPRTSCWPAVRIPRFSRAARFGFHKICRKTGEFADAIGVAVHRSRPRRLLGSSRARLPAAPIVIEDADARSQRTRRTSPTSQRRLVQAGLDRRRLRPQAARHRRPPRHPSR